MEPAKGESTRPAANECAEYYMGYIGQVPDGDIIERLARQAFETRGVMESFTGERETYRYEAGKWSPREIAGHLIDSERVFASRALAFARGDPAHRPSMDQDQWVAASNAGSRPLAELADELEAVRRSNVLMFRGFPPPAWDARGVASEVEFTVRSLAWIIAGHQLHHMRVLRERY